MGNWKQLKVSVVGTQDSAAAPEVRVSRVWNPALIQVQPLPGTAPPKSHEASSGQWHQRSGVDFTWGQLSDREEVLPGTRASPPPGALHETGHISRRTPHHPRVWEHFLKLGTS